MPSTSTRISGSTSCGSASPVVRPIQATMPSATTYAVPAAARLTSGASTERCQMPTTSRISRSVPAVMAGSESRIACDCSTRAGTTPVTPIIASPALGSERATSCATATRRSNVSDGSKYRKVSAVVERSSRVDMAPSTLMTGTAARRPLAAASPPAVMRAARSTTRRCAASDSPFGSRCTSATSVSSG